VKVICECIDLTDEEIVIMTRGHEVRTVDDVRRLTKACRYCGSCALRIQQFLNDHVGREC
jgi:NAD(P)H-nitrite reductase large subunit